MTNYSIVMCVYKNDKTNYFKEALDSVINQKFRTNDLVIVIDGPIEKEIKKVIQEYRSNNSFINVLELKSNVGLGMAMNEGIKICKNDIVARMDSDDISVNNRFFKQLKVMEAGNYDIVGSLIEEIDSDGKKTGYVRLVPESNEKIMKFMRYRSPFNHPTVMFRKKVILENDGYQNIRFFEDYYLFIKLMNQGYRGYNLQEILVYMRADKGLYERRGGINYLKKFFIFEKRLLKEKYINRFYYFLSIVTRVPIMIMPAIIRKFIYRLILRKKVN